MAGVLVAVAWRLSIRWGGKPGCGERWTEPPRSSLVPTASLQTNAHWLAGWVPHEQDWCKRRN